MVTKDKIDRFYKDVDDLGLKFPVAAISKATGFVKGNVSDYLNKKKEPSENFLNSFYEAFKDSINVPRVTNGREDYLSGKNLENFSEAHRQLATAIARALPETRQDQVLAPKLAEWIQEFYSGKKVVPIDELLKELKKASMPNSSYKQ